MSAKLYTKTGDKGQTSLLGGKKVSKTDLRIEAYGNVDELNSFIGRLKDQNAIDKDLGNQLLIIQELLFTIGSILATEEDFKGFELPKISESHVKQLEDWIDQLDAEVPPLKNFILPGGHQAISLSHVCRTICRRTERSAIAAADHSKIAPELLKFLNRLSDYFFIFARVLGVRQEVSEIPWTPNKD